MSIVSELEFFLNEKRRAKGDDRSERDRAQEQTSEWNGTWPNGENTTKPIHSAHRTQKYENMKKEKAQKKTQK